MGIIALILLSSPVMTRGQTDTDVFIDVAKEPQELSPLDSLIQYPKIAKKNGIEGKVTLQALVEKDGSVSKVEILKSSDTIFNQEAIRAFKSEHFTPAIQEDGTPVKLWITRIINFRLGTKPSQDSSGYRSKF